MALTLQHEASPGRHLLERYELQEFLSSDLPGRTPGNPWGRSLVEQSQEDPGGTPASRPPVMKYIEASTYSKLSHLGQGSFGDTWKAYDRLKRKNVALKIFYHDADDEEKYVDWNSASNEIKKDLKENAAECALQQWLVAQRGVYEKGAAHICQCYAEHVMDQKHSNRPCFLVLEMCGDAMSDVIHGRKGHQPLDRAGANKLMKQLLEGLKFLNKLKMIHHDIKPANIVVHPQTMYLKLIDFGATVKATDAWRHAWLSQTPAYAAPEGEDRGFHMAANGTGSSFDIYAAGLIWLEALCPRLSSDHWFDDPDASAVSTDAARTARREASHLCPLVEIWKDETRSIYAMTRSRASTRSTPSEVLAMKPLINVDDVAPPDDFPDSPPPPAGFRPAEGPEPEPPVVPKKKNKKKNKKKAVAVVAAEDMEEIGSS
eukprot:TRINITY_DN1699_c0_g2_i1.p1 TRINITY_DN1699_c0_g2~~TRINITY_DN1699_c0_g2_i1.p1  ORF type:complete len:483 (-),score=74.45 TRINITY_DN1699_c0_g2_i1:171-1460(-)